MHRFLLSAAVCGLALLAGPAAADDTEGVVRLNPQPMDVTTPMPVARDASVMPASHCSTCQSGTIDSAFGTGYGCPGSTCPGGACGPAGMCPLKTLGYGWNDGYCRHCNGCGAGGKLCWAKDVFGDKIRCIFGNYGGCTHAPGEGYITPSRRPIWDLSVPTTAMWSSYWLCGKGQAAPGTKPPVFMPTDTTQLGYSYSHVPYWMPKGGMVPPLPIPNQYHDRTCFSRCKACGTDAGLPGEYPTGYAAQPTPTNVASGPQMPAK